METLPQLVAPQAPTAVAVALADKIDSLVGFFAIDEKPTGSRDPFALRRAALGVIRIVTENGIRVPLREAIKASYMLLPPEVRKEWEARMRASDIAAKELGWIESEAKLDPGFELGYILISFFADRLKVHLREKGVRHDHIDAVFALGEDDLVRLLARVDALDIFLNTDDGANLLVAYRRAANIVAIEEKKDGRSYEGEADAGRLQQDEEKALFAALAGVEGRSDPAIKAEDFEEAMFALAHLRAPVDAFFDHVTVNCDDGDLRENRLLLLSRIRSAMDQVADFSKIEG